MPMSAARRVVAGLGMGLVLALGAGLGGLAGSPVAAAPSDNTDFVKYYTVTASYQGAPENLSEIATRLLGSAGRAADIFSLNSGRTQPDGGALTDPAKLKAGWSLVLPWDAVGDGVKYGLLPTGAPVAPPAPAGTRTPKSTATPKPGATGTSTATATATPGKAAGGGTCAVASASSTQTDWATLRLAPDQAWSHSRGKGQLIAVVDSGVDGSLPQLTGHVASGADVVTGSGRGDTDCLGTGTAMAGLIVAQPTQSSGLTGMAPDATVMPVRVVTTTPTAQAAQAATAIEVATSAGATVIALGSYVNPGDPKVAAAIAAAGKHDVVVVAGAPSGSVPVDPSAATVKSVVRVGGVAVDGQRAAEYRAGAVDLVAPGINVSSLGVTGAGPVNGTGTQYAVAFVAGEAALIRGAYPDLTAIQVVHRLEATADQMGDVAPDSRYGYGLINPGTSVTKVLPEEARSGDPVARNTFSAAPATNRGLLLILIGLVGLAAAALLVLRVRRLMRAEPEGGDTEAPSPSTVEKSAAPAGDPATMPTVDVWVPPRSPGSLSERLTAARAGQPEEPTPAEKDER